MKNEEIIKNQTKYKSGGRAKEANESPRKSSQGKSPRKSSRGKSSRKTGEVKETENVKISFVKEDKKNSPAVLKKGLSFSSASPRKSLAKNKKSIVKMMTMSQSYAATDESPKKAPEAKPKSPKKKSTKKKKDKQLKGKARGTPDSSRNAGASYTQPEIKA